MFSEDYLVRIISQALAALMNAIGMRKAGKNSEALQMIEQGIQQLTGLSADLIDQMEDASILSMLTTAEKLETGRLAILADLYQEEGTIFFKMGKHVPGIFATMRSLRFNLEVVLADDNPFSPETMVKIEGLVQKLNQDPLAIDTQLALSDFYRRLLDSDDQTLAIGGISRRNIEQALNKLQDQIDASMTL